LSQKHADGKGGHPGRKPPQRATTSSDNVKRSGPYRVTRFGQFFPVMVLSIARASLKPAPKAQKYAFQIKLSEIG
jgi:hypothetical protein